MYVVLQQTGSTPTLTSDLLELYYPWTIRQFNPYVIRSILLYLLISPNWTAMNSTPGPISGTTDLNNVNASAPALTPREMGSAKKGCFNLARWVGYSYV